MTETTTQDPQPQGSGAGMDAVDEQLAPPAGRARGPYLWGTRRSIGRTLRLAWLLLAWLLLSEHARQPTAGVNGGPWAVPEGPERSGGRCRRRRAGAR